MSAPKHDNQKASQKDQTDSLVKSIGLITFAFLLYYISARLGLEVATINKQASPVWPATGIGMSLIFLFGQRTAVGIFAGALLSNYETGLSILAAAAIAAGNSLESLFFVWAFKRGILKHNSYGIHSRAINGIFLFVLAASISATVGSLVLWGTSVIPTQALTMNWTTWWVGDFLGALFIFPIAFILKVTKQKLSILNWSQAVRLALCLLLATSLVLFVFETNFGKPYLFLIFIPLLLAANWLHTVWIYIVSLCICALSIYQTVIGNGPFSNSSLNEGLVHLQIFLAGISITAVGLGSLKQEGFHFKTNLTLLFGWILSGMSFYFSFTTTAAKDRSQLLSRVSQAEEAVESRMNDYVRALESGVSFFNASEHVSKEEWRLFASKILSTNQYPGIEGIGVIFSSTIKKRFGHPNLDIIKYQPNMPMHDVPDLPDVMSIKTPEDKFIITYIEPLQTNKAAVGLNVSSEKHRYDAAIKSRDTGQPTMTDVIFLVQDQKSRPGILIYVPIYKSGANIESTKDRREAFIGFVYAPVIFEKFLHSAIKQFENDVLLSSHSFSDYRNTPTVRKTRNEDAPEDIVYRSHITLIGKAIEVAWKRGLKSESSLSFVASWIGFFGAISSLLLAVILSSLQNLTMRAQSIAASITKELDERKRTWQALTETSPVGIYLTDKQGHCTYVNSKWSQMTGLSPDEATGTGWISAIHPDDRDLVESNWNRFVMGSTFECNYRYMRRNGEVIYVTGQAISLKDEAGHITGYFGTVQDITQLHQNQIALLTSSRMSSLGQMASGIAHEINNPLAIIQGKAMYLDKILAGTGLELAQKQVKQIYNTVQRIAKVIRGLQAFSREITIEPPRVSSVKNILSDTLELCRERFAHHKVRLTVPSEANPELCFWGHPEQISQVLVNLLNNAFDAAMESADKWVKIDIHEYSEKIQIIVTDSGAGINPSILDKIFDPFFTTKEVGRGTGLGLSISKGIIDRHNGKLYVDSTKSKTTFVVELLKKANSKPSVVA